MLTTLRKILPQNSFLRRWYSSVNAFFAALFYGFPAYSLLCIGITGTDGKTTTTEMLAHILRSNHKKVLSISTVATVCGTTHIPTDKRTTPSPWILQKLLKRAKKEGISFAVIEVSSHALSQKRVFGIPFSAAILTNITPEHLDYHKTMAEYANAKKLLFTKKLKKNGVAVLNFSDSFGEKWQKEYVQKLQHSNTQQSPSMLLYSNSPNKNALSHNKISFLHTGMECVLRAENGKTAKLFLPLFGEFNIQNAMAAIQTARFFGISLESAAKSFVSFSGVKGRMEPIFLGQDFFVLVDFALTPEAIKNLLQSARNIAPHGKIFLIFGSCGTHPDIHIRKDMGEMAAKYADVVIVTDDEPYYESPAQIRSHILSGANAVSSSTKTAEIHEIADRQQAMEFACSMAKKGDVVLVSGMGHLHSRNINGKEVEWNDGNVLRTILHSQWEK